MTSMNSVERFRPLLEFIAKNEGTASQPARGYNTSLAYGKFTDGEQPLTRMTLAAIDELQTRMLRHPANTFNSSALGRYQIVRKTLRGLRQQLGLSPIELYSPALQDKLAVALIKRRGRDARGLQLEWASLQRISPAVILQKYDEKWGTQRLPEDFVEDARPAVAEEVDHAEPEQEQIVLRPGDRGAMVKALQEDLAQRQYQVGDADGIYGTLTTGAVAAFQADYRVPTGVTGTVDASTWQMLKVASSRPLSPERRQATAADLKRKGSVIIANADHTRLFGWISSALGGLGLGNSAFGLVGSASANPAPAANAAGKTVIEALVQAVARSDIASLKTLFVNGQDAQLRNAILKAQQEAFLLLEKAANAAPAVAPRGTGATIEQVLPTILSGIIPNAGGSAAMLGLGVLMHLFGSRIIDRRVEAQRTGSFIGQIGV